MSKAAMKLALDAPEGCYGRTKRYGVNRARAIVSLSQALAEPEQPARVPLTQPDKQRLWNDACHNNRSSANDAAMEFGTLVEAAHGIKPVCFGPHDPVQE